MLSVSRETCRNKSQFLYAFFLTVSVMVTYLSSLLRFMIRFLSQDFCILEMNLYMLEHIFSDDKNCDGSLLLSGCGMFIS